MKLSLCKSAYVKVLRPFLNSTSTLNFSTIARSDTLYRRISPVGDPKASVVPVLDQWVAEGRHVDRTQLRTIIKELNVYRRFQHALEISQWMTDKRYIPLSQVDVASRLKLILRVHGLEQAEEYFNNLPQQLKGFEVYTALLRCYASEKSLEKAESVMQKVMDMGFARTPWCYNILLNLYYHVGSKEKFDALMHEMEEKGFYNDDTFTIRLNAYAASFDSDGMDSTVEKMESDPRVILKCSTYAVAAHGYLKVGQVDKALEMLKKSERHIATDKRKKIAFRALIKLYAQAGNKDGLYRIWNMYKNSGKVYNTGYVTMLSSLLDINDIEGAEKIFKEWESTGLYYDFRIPNFLIDAYCRNGNFGKAEALLNECIGKGGNPNHRTWCHLAGGYFLDNQVPKAVEAMTKAIMVFSPSSKLRKDNILVTCLEYLQGKGDVGQAEEFISQLRTEGIFSAAVHEKLLQYIKDMKE